MPPKADTSGQREGFSPSQERALQALLEGVTLQQASRLSKLSERQIRRYLQEEPFTRAYLARRRQQVGVGLHVLQRSATAAAIALGQALTSQEPPAVVSVRIRTAGLILDYALKGLEMESIAERVAALEARLVSLEQERQP